MNFTNVFFSFFDVHIIFQNRIDDGQVILVNSMSGHRLSPLGGKTRFYSATKFAVNALLEGRLTNYKLINQFHFQNKIDDGQVILVNSMSGHRVAPSAKTRFYTATKFAVTALLEGKKSKKN